MTVVINENACIRTAGDQALQNGVSRAIQLPIADGFNANPLPLKAERAGKFLGFDAAGQPVVSSGTGADAGLRGDLATSAGASLIGTANAMTQQAVNNLVLARVQLVDDLGADPTGLVDSSAAFINALSSGYLNLKEGGVYLLNSPLTRSGFLRVKGNARLIFAFNGTGLAVNGSGADVDLGGATYDGAATLGFKRRSVVRLTNVGKVKAYRHTITNVYNDTDSTLALYLFNYGNTELTDGVYKDITGLGNGTIGDAIGAIRAVYGSGTGHCGYLRITGGSVDNVNTVNNVGVVIDEDADAFVTQTSTFNADLIVSGVMFSNVGKRLAKTQNAATSLTKVNDCVGSSAWPVINPTGSNNGMFSIASAYGGAFVFTNNVFKGGACGYMIETLGAMTVIESGNVYKPTYAAQINSAQTRPYLHSAATSANAIHALSFITNVAQGSSMSGAGNMVETSNIISYTLLGSQMTAVNNHVCSSNIMTGAGINAAIQYISSIQNFTVNSNILSNWQDGGYVSSGISTTHLAGTFANNIFDKITRNNVSEFEPAAIGKVGMSGNYSDVLTKTFFKLLASTPNAPTLSAGAGTALPALPAAYMSVTINGTVRYIPFY